QVPRGQDRQVLPQRARRPGEPSDRGSPGQAAEASDQPVLTIDDRSRTRPAGPSQKGPAGSFLVGQALGHGLSSDPVHPRPPPRKRGGRKKKPSPLAGEGWVGGRPPAWF